MPPELPHNRTRIQRAPAVSIAIQPIGSTAAPSRSAAPAISSDASRAIRSGAPAALKAA